MHTSTYTWDTTRSPADDLRHLYEDLMANTGFLTVDLETVGVLATLDDRTWLLDPNYNVIGEYNTYFQALVFGPPPRFDLEMFLAMMN